MPLHTAGFTNDEAFCHGRASCWLVLEAQGAGASELSDTRYAPPAAILYRGFEAVGALRLLL